jgi:hypothetical protein
MSPMDGVSCFQAAASSCDEKLRSIGCGGKKDQLGVSSDSFAPQNVDQSPPSGFELHNCS